MTDSRDIFRQVGDAIDIADIIGENLTLKRAGREFKGLCPFHPDHRPSMSVVPHKQIFHCFVCGEGGDVFKFLQLYHKMTPGESLRMLAQRAGIKLPELPARRGEGPSPQERIRAANDWACDFFQQYLQTPSGKPGLDYLRGRGLTDETIAKFRLGMAPDGWSGLITAAIKAARTTGDMIEAGLLKKRGDGSPYDAFRNRVIFPIVDAIGRVIAFGGRVLEEKRDEAGNVTEAKYLNSPDSPLFNKSATLYGIDQARQSISRTETAVIVEGYMDVIAAHQSGVGNVVATLGTALTPEHAAALKRYAKVIVLVFDSDDAGRHAADRALEVFVQGSLDIRLTSVHDGKDPCDFCLAHGGDAFHSIVKAAPDGLDYRWHQTRKRVDTGNSITGKQQAVTEYLDFLRTTFEKKPIDPIRRAMILQQASALTGIPQAQVVTAIEKRVQARPVQRALPAPASIEVDEHIDLDSLTGRPAAEAQLLGCLLARSSLYYGVADQLTLESFKEFGPLANAMVEAFENQTSQADMPLLEILDCLPGKMGPLVMALERRIGLLIEPENLSPNHAELVKRAMRDRGDLLGVIVRDCLAVLHPKKREVLFVVPK